VSAILTPFTNAGVAQRQSNCLVNSRLQVQLLSPAPECECGAVASIPGFQPGDTSFSEGDASRTSLVIRSRSLVTQLGECLSYKEEVAGSIPAEITNNGNVA
jgi:hypothetical protein